MADDPLGGRDTRSAPSLSEVLADWEAERELSSAGRKAVYVSAPITTGPHFVDWYHRVGRHLADDPDAYSRAHRADVILPNTQRMARFLELLRWRHVGVVIDPTSLSVQGWTQALYHAFWKEVIRRHVRRVVFLDGWNFSNGCAVEFEEAQRLDLDCVDQRLDDLSREHGIGLLKEAVSEARELGLDMSQIDAVIERLSADRPGPASATRRLLFKDETLHHLAATANVAQFVSFSPNTLTQRFCRIRGIEPNYKFESTSNAVSQLLERSPEGMVNIRSFDPERPEGNPFQRRLRDVGQILEKLHELGAKGGLYTIINETIDESDGGVSGVYHRGVLEFAPDTTPRCVDDESVDTAAFPFELGMRLLHNVYGFEPDLRGREGARVEFSIHPKPRGWLHAHTVIWQLEHRSTSNLDISIDWPNGFSRFLGDKAFGLALAAVAGLRVPRTAVFGHRFFPFVFGERTGVGKIWTRTCPEIKLPGFFGSAPRWHDPYEVLKNPWVLDPDQRLRLSSPTVSLRSVIVQEAINPEYSGRAIFWDNETSSIEGVRGGGSAFMVGDIAASPLPFYVIDAVTEVLEHARVNFGSIGIEWVYDGELAWIVQMNRAQSRISERPEREDIEWIEFHAGPGRIEAFREAVAGMKKGKQGILVVGNVSPLSHWGEIAEMHDVSARFIRE